MTVLANLIGRNLLSAAPLLKVLGILLVSALANSSFIFFFVSFFRTSNAFAIASTVICSLLGFIAGIYIPTGVLPATVQTFIKIFPISHVGSVLRQVMMEAPMSGTFANAPVQAVKEFKSMMGVVFYTGEKPISLLVSISIIAGVGILFYILDVIRISIKKKI